VDGDNSRFFATRPRPLDHRFSNPQLGGDRARDGEKEREKEREREREEREKQTDRQTQES